MCKSSDPENDIKRGRSWKRTRRKKDKKIRSVDPKRTVDSGGTGTNSLKSLRNNQLKREEILDRSRPESRDKPESMKVFSPARCLH